MIRYNLNAIELNEEGFEKLSSEIALAPMAGNFPMPWGKERVQLYFGEVPLAGVARTDRYSKGFYPAIAARGEDWRRGEQGLLRSLHGCAAGGGCAEEVSECFREELNGLRENRNLSSGVEAPVMMLALCCVATRQKSPQRLKPHWIARQLRHG